MQGISLTQLLLDTLCKQSRPDLLWHKVEGEWKTISTDTYLRRVAAAARFLRECGIQKGDRVAVFSENRPEWHMADLAILGVGAVNVPLYFAESPERLHYILADSESRLCFVSGAEQFAKVREVWSQLPALEKVIPFQPLDSVGAQADARVVSWQVAAREDVSHERVEEFTRNALRAKPDDVATLIYTSGTTGKPKGVLLTHNNLASNVQGCMGRLGYVQTDLVMSVLPLCHIYERTNSYSYFAAGTPIAYAESFEKVADNLREIRPTVMAAVPRFFEKLYQRVMDSVRQASPLRQKLFHWALEVGRRALPHRLQGRTPPGWLGLQYRLAERLIYRKLRQQLGGRFRFFVSGGAPLSKPLNQFFHAMGLMIYEGYGLTETSPVISLNIPGATKLGTVGKPIPGVEVKIADDGEILTRGPHIMQGYYKLEEETSKVLRDGWFYTGDVGFLDDEGFLTITDRKKDLIKTAAGKMIAPQPIENQLKASPFIANAVVIGDRRKYIVALLVPNFAQLEHYAAQQGVAANSPAELTSHPSVQELLEGEVERVNRRLAQFERIKRFALLEKDFTFADGQLTYTQKVRRRKIEEEFRTLIDSLYSEEARPSTA